MKHFKKFNVKDTSCDLLDLIPGGPDGGREIKFGAPS